MKYKFISTLLILALVLGMGTVATADSQGYNGTASNTSDVTTEGKEVEDKTQDGSENPTGLVINQQQLQRTVSNGTVTLNAYKANEQLTAGVYESEDTFNQYEAVTIGDKTYKFWREIDNTVDDIVTVTNVETEGSTTAYVRTVFAFPVFSDGETHLHLNFYKPSNAKSMEGILEEVDGVAEIEGQNYKLYVYNYNNPLAPGETTEPSLLEYVFDDDVTSELFEEFPQGSYKVLITSQAVQETGFASVVKAFNGAFSKVTAINHPWGNNN